MKGPYLKINAADRLNTLPT